MIRRTASICVLLLSFCVASERLHAHVDGLPSLHDTVVAIQKRLLETVPQDKLLKLDDEQLRSFLTEEEGLVLGTGHIRFTVNVPVIVTVIRDVETVDGPYWLTERGFEQVEGRVAYDGNPFDIWRKAFDAGRIGLGANSLFEGENHYLIAVAPQTPGDSLEIEDIYPGQCRLAALERGLRPYVDDYDRIDSVPADLQGTTLICPANGWSSDANLLNFFRETRFPATASPDQIVLTWSDEPTTTQTIQWRTSTKVSSGKVAYVKKSDYNRFRPKQPRHADAETVELETLNIANDPVCNRHTITLRDLDPDTTYLYSVGGESEEAWTEFAEFTTAPDRTRPFSFIYMGDVQNGMDRWGTLVHNAFRERPDAEFYVMAGDLVNRGNERWDWDDFFYNAEGIFDRRTLVPVIGNHDCQDGDPYLYLDLFTLRTNGPDTIAPERAYSFEYSNALFVILDSNLPPQTQVEWLEEQLAGSDAKWKFVVNHHPTYSSKGNRDNRTMREAWSPLLDKYHVDMALQGHDHAYLRTYPMNDNQQVEKPAEGTIYIVSVSGMKMYDQGSHDYTAFGMTNVPTYQVLDIQVTRDRLVYRAYDIDGNVRDEIVIEK